MTGKFLDDKRHARTVLVSDRKDLVNFHARLEMKLNKGSTRVNVHGQLPGRTVNEMFLSFDNQPDSAFGVSVRKQDGKIPFKYFRFDSAKLRDKWFTLEIIARGGGITYRINGTTVAHVDGARFQPGHLSFDVADLGAILSVRKIEIRELPSATEPAFQPLFNGKDLTGWTSSGKEWKVENDSLISTSTTKPSLLRTEKAFQNFILRFEHGLDTGVILREMLEVYLHGPGKEIDKQAQQAAIYFVDMGHGMYGLRDHQGKTIKNSGGFFKEAYKPMTWNQVEIQSLNGQITVTANGTLVTKFTLPQARAGTIGLKAYHQDQSRWRFRNIEIKELSAK